MGLLTANKCPHTPRYDLAAVNEMLASAACLRGLSLVHESNGDLQTYKEAMKMLLSSVRCCSHSFILVLTINLNILVFFLNLNLFFLISLLSSLFHSYAEKAKNPALCVTTAKHYWNTCLPLTHTPEGRWQLQDPLERILNALIHTTKQTNVKNKTLSHLSHLYQLIPPWTF